MNSNYGNRSVVNPQADWLEVYAANIEALGKTFGIITQAVHELTCIATRRNDPFKPVELQGPIEDYFRAAKPIAVQWRKPEGNDTGERTDMLYLSEFAANPLLAPFFMMLAKGPLERVDVPGTFGQYRVTKNTLGAMKAPRRVKWDHPDNASQVCLIASEIEVRSIPMGARLGDPIEVSARSTHDLAKRALRRPYV